MSVSAARRTGAIFSALVLAGCGVSGDGATTGRAETPEQRAAGIYAAVLQKWLADAPRAIGDPADMYVVEQAYVKGGWAFEVRNPKGEPIPPEVRTALGKALAGTAELTWVATEEEVVREGVSEAGIPCPFLRAGDLVVTLDTLSQVGDSDEVSVAVVGNEFRDNDCAVHWLRTYVVEASGSGWEVTGQTVPSGMS